MDKDDVLDATFICTMIYVTTLLNLYICCTKRKHKVWVNSSIWVLHARLFEICLYYCARCQSYDFRNMHDVILWRNKSRVQWQVVNGWMTRCCGFVTTNPLSTTNRCHGFWAYESAKAEKQCYTSYGCYAQTRLLRCRPSRELGHDICVYIRTNLSSERECR